jgi:hypothetical protein
MENLLQWMVDGNFVKDEYDHIYTLKSIIIEHNGAEQTDIDTREILREGILDKLSIYKTKEQLYIEELEAKLRTYEKYSNHKDGRKPHHHLSQGDVKDIEEAIRKHTKKKWILSTYDISTTTFYRIKSGTHVLSTNKNQHIKSL